MTIRETDPGIDDSKITWILGSSRSGSTWMTRMLAAHPGILIVNETHVGHHLGVRRPLSIAWSVGSETPEMTTLLERIADHDDYLFAGARRQRWVPLLRALLFDTLDDAIERSGGKGGRDVRIVIKEPSGAGVADVLFEMTPAAKLVLLVRDGRDAVTSWLAAYRPGGWIMTEGGFPLSDRGRSAFIAWQADLWAHRISAAQAVYDRLPPERRLLIRYEDLLVSPVEWMDRLMSFIGVSASKAAITASVTKHRIDNVPPSVRHDRGRIRNGSAGAWRQELSEDEQEFLCDRIGRLLARYGYET